MAKRLDPDGYLHFVMQEYAGKRDARSLIPVAEARAIVKAQRSSQFANQDAHSLFQAAVCSLADARAKKVRSPFA